MNRNFKPTSTWVRVTFAAASVVTTVAIVSAIGALAVHYEAESQLAGAPAVMVAQR